MSFSLGSVIAGLTVSGIPGAPATGAKVSKTLMCHASVLQKDRQDINADDKWPKHLIMQLIPQAVRWIIHDRSFCGWMILWSGVLIFKNQSDNHEVSFPPHNNHNTELTVRLPFKA